MIALVIFAQIAQAGVRQHYEDMLKNELGHEVTLKTKGWDSAPSDKSDIPEKLAGDVAQELHYLMDRKPKSKATIQKNLKSITVVYSKSEKKNPELKWVGSDLEVHADPLTLDRRWSGAIQTQIESVIPNDFKTLDKRDDYDQRVQLSLSHLNKDLTQVFHEKKELSASVDWASMKSLSDKDIDNALLAYIHFLSGIGSGMKNFIGFSSGRKAVVTKMKTFLLQYKADAPNSVALDSQTLIFHIRSKDLNQRAIDIPSKEELLTVLE